MSYDNPSFHHLKNEAEANGGLTKVGSHVSFTPDTKTDKDKKDTPDSLIDIPQSEVLPWKRNSLGSIPSMTSSYSKGAYCDSDKPRKLKALAILVSTLGFNPCFGIPSYLWASQGLKLARSDLGEEALAMCDRSEKCSLYGMAVSSFLAVVAVALVVALSNMGMLD